MISVPGDFWSLTINKGGMTIDYELRSEEVTGQRLFICLPAFIPLLYPLFDLRSSFSIFFLLPPNLIFFSFISCSFSRITLYSLFLFFTLLLPIFFSFATIFPSFSLFPLPSHCLFFSLCSHSSFSFSLLLRFLVLFLPHAQLSPDPESPFANGQRAVTTATMVFLHSSLSKRPSQFANTYPKKTGANRK